MKQKVLIIGEYIEDVHVFCKVERVSPDKFVPVLRPIKTVKTPGGAANCYENLKAMFPELDIYFICQEKHIIKTRYLEASTNQHYIRIDEFDKVESPLTIVQLVELLGKQGIRLSDFAAIGISDYGKGFVTKELINEISQNAQTFLDTKHILDKSWSKHVFCVKINNKEYETNQAANSDFSCQNLIVTRGGDGTTVNGVLYESYRVEVRDTSGAGDSFFATIIGCYLNGIDFSESVPLANQVCSLLATRQGVNIMNKKDLQRAASLLNYQL